MEYYTQVLKPSLNDLCRSKLAYETLKYAFWLSLLSHVSFIAFKVMRGAGFALVRADIEGTALRMWIVFEVSLTVNSSAESSFWLFAFINFALSRVAISPVTSKFVHGPSRDDLAVWFKCTRRAVWLWRRFPKLRSMHLWSDISRFADLSGTHLTIKSILHSLVPYRVPSLDCITALTSILRWL
jgi:hypothetical protein